MFHLIRNSYGAPVWVGHLLSGNLIRGRLYDPWCAPRRVFCLLGRQKDHKARGKTGHDLDPSLYLLPDPSYL
jgi:hypothetical protein